MKRTAMTAATTALVLMLGLAGAGYAETHQVQMLNRGEAGPMVFEPAFLRVAPGDTVHFVATDRGHNAESIDGMIPAGAEAFTSRVGQELEVTLDTEGVYGVRCTPHFAMGMVMTIVVGEASAAPEDFLAGRIPPRARERFEAQLGNL
ncbi:pseudoazurin [Pararhodobacter aggregans]